MYIFVGGYNESIVTRYFKKPNIRENEYEVRGIDVIQIYIYFQYHKLKGISFQKAHLEAESTYLKKN